MGQIPFVRLAWFPGWTPGDTPLCACAVCTNVPRAAQHPVSSMDLLHFWGQALGVTHTPRVLLPCGWHV